MVDKERERIGRRVEEAEGRGGGGKFVKRTNEEQLLSCRQTQPHHMARHLGTLYMWLLELLWTRHRCRKSQTEREREREKSEEGTAS